MASHNKMPPGKAVSSTAALDLMTAALGSSTVSQMLNEIRQEAADVPHRDILPLWKSAAGVVREALMSGSSVATQACERHSNLVGRLVAGDMTRYRGIRDILKDFMARLEYFSPENLLDAPVMEERLTHAMALCASQEPYVRLMVLLAAMEVLFTTIGTPDKEWESKAREQELRNTGLLQEHANIKHKVDTAEDKTAELEKQLGAAKKTIAAQKKELSTLNKNNAVLSTGPTATERQALTDERREHNATKQLLKQYKRQTVDRESREILTAALEAQKAIESGQDIRLVSFVIEVQKKQKAFSKLLAAGPTRAKGNLSAFSQLIDIKANFNSMQSDLHNKANDVLKMSPGLRAKGFHHYQASLEADEGDKRSRG